MSGKAFKALLIIYTTTLSFTSAQQRLVNIGDFVTIAGDTIYNCTLGYRTFGKLNADSSNVIIYPTWFGGTSEDVGKLVADDKLLNPDGFYVIVIDALGNGISTSPSNYESGKSFPEISIRDMINSQFILLNEYMRLKTIYGAIGGSMGSMQVLEWISHFPGYIKKAVAYVSSPKPTGHDLLQWNIRLQIIDSYRELGSTDTQIQKLLNMQSALMGRTPDWNAENIDSDEFEKYLEKFDNPKETRFTVDNYRTQLKAMLSHNIYKNYNGSTEETVNNIKAKILMIVSKTDHLVHPKSAIEFAQQSGAKIYLLENNGGHLGITPEMDYCSKIINEFFRN